MYNLLEKSEDMSIYRVLDDLEDWRNVIVHMHYIKNPSEEEIHDFNEHYRKVNKLRAKNSVRSFEMGQRLTIQENDFDFQIVQINRSENTFMGKMIEEAKTND
jgi:hypothetical protein